MSVLGLTRYLVSTARSSLFLSLSVSVLMSLFDERAARRIVRSVAMIELLNPGLAAVFLFSLSRLLSLSLYPRFSLFSSYSFPTVHVRTVSPTISFPRDEDRAIIVCVFPDFCRSDALRYHDRRRRTSRDRGKQTRTCEID